MLNPCFTDGEITHLASIYQGGYRCLYLLLRLPGVESRDWFKGQDKNIKSIYGVRLSAHGFIDLNLPLFHHVCGTLLCNIAELSTYRWLQQYCLPYKSYSDMYYFFKIPLLYSLAWFVSGFCNIVKM